MVRRESTLQSGQGTFLRGHLRERLAVFIIAIEAMLFQTVQADSNRVLYADAAAAGKNDGSSWVNAYRYLQDALARASTLKSSVEIRVAQGIYKPDQSSANPDGTRDQSAKFNLLDNVIISGGFAGLNGSKPDARDVGLYETILSGDLAGNDIPVVDPYDLLTEPTRNENSHTIVAAGTSSRSAALDGFTITAGNAMRTRVGGGAGLYLSGTTLAPCCPSIRNCIFLENVGGAGSAVAVSSGYPELVDCTFIRNAASVEGGAIHISGYSTSPSLTCQFVIRRCTFDNNYAGQTGGAIQMWGFPPIIEDSTFRRNIAQKGGSIYLASYEAHAEIVNCRFICNVADEAGSAVYFRFEKGLNMASCTLFGSGAKGGRMIACLEPLRKDLPVPSATITNTILWGSDDAIYVSKHVQVNVTYSNIQSGWPGKDNIDTDPLFANPVNWNPDAPHDPNALWVAGDYHLMSQGGRWDPNSQTWVKDSVTSPCIDAGDPNSPVGDEPFPNGGRINMGAYGGTTEASKSYFGEPVCETILAGDVNGDCKVDLKDLAILTQHWLGTAGKDSSE